MAPGLTDSVSAQDVVTANSEAPSWYRECDVFVHRGHEMVYRFLPGSGVPTLLIHGYPTASWDWHRIWAPLAELGPTIAFDMLGFGHSAKPRIRYSIFDQADLAEALCAELGFDRVHVLAHDYGDTVAQELLARHQEKGPLEIETCYLLNGGIIPGYHRPTLVQKLLASPFGGLIARLMRKRRFERTFTRIFGPDTPPSQAELDVCWGLIEYNQGRRVIAAVSRYMHERRQFYDRWVGALATAELPVRVLIGAQDPISGGHMVEPLERLAPQVSVRVLDTIGHYPQLEAPSEVAADYLEFRRVNQPA